MIIVVAIILLGVGAGVGIFLYLKKKEGDEEPTEESIEKNTIENTPPPDQMEQTYDQLHGPP
ncbi:MAG: hypothetical protein ACMUIG_01840 [Thermoplasmatota archaeon]